MSGYTWGTAIEDAQVLNDSTISNIPPTPWASGCDCRPITRAQFYPAALPISNPRLTLAASGELIVNTVNVTVIHGGTAIDRRSGNHRIE